MRSYCCRQCKEDCPQVNRLRAELDSCDKYAKEQYKAYDETIARLRAEVEENKYTLKIGTMATDALVKNRDAWKAKALKYEKALRSIHTVASVRDAHTEAAQVLAPEGEKA